MLLHRKVNYLFEIFEMAYNISEWKSISETPKASLSSEDTQQVLPPVDLVVAPVAQKGQDYISSTLCSGGEGMAHLHLGHNKSTN